MSYPLRMKAHTRYRLIFTHCNSDFAYKGWHAYIVPEDQTEPGEHYEWLAHMHFLFTIHRCLNQAFNLNLTKPDGNTGYYTFTEEASKEFPTGVYLTTGDWSQTIHSLEKPD